MLVEKVENFCGFQGSATIVGSRATEYSAHTKYYPRRSFMKTVPSPTITPLEHRCTTKNRAPFSCEGNGYYVVQLEMPIDQIREENLKLLGR